MKKIIFAIIVTVLVFNFLPWLQDHDAIGSPGAYFVQHGKASWYSRNDAGERTANNENFNDQALTCAMWGVEFGRKVRVTNLANGKSVTLRVNDRGPHERFVRAGRIVDLTQGAFAKISSTEAGIIEVMVEFL